MLQSSRIRSLGVLVALTFSLTGIVYAGPPFVTDDPEPVEYQHWEFYLSTQQYRDSAGWSGTLPHVELNYGVVPEVQLHLIAPLAYSKATGDMWHQGYGDTELGVKYRFVNIGDEKDAFMIGTFPLVELATGSHERDLGNGRTQVFLPIWIQKNFDEWSTYGGGGWWHNPGEGNRDYWFAGWQVQRKITEEFATGLEVQFRTAQTMNTGNSWALNAGGMWDLSEKYHLIFSAGHSISGRSQFQGYLALQITWGADDEKAASKK